MSNLDSSMTRRLAFVCHSAGLGGAERSLLELTSGLVKAGDVVHVILPHAGPLFQVLRQSEIEAHVVEFSRWASRKRRRLRGVRRLMQHLRSGYAMARLLRRLHPDVVVTNTLTAPAGAIAARLLGIPHVWYLREFGDRDHGLHFDLGFRGSAWLIDRLSQLIIVNSEAVRAHFEPWIDPVKLHRNYNAVEVTSAKEIPRFSREERIRRERQLRCVFVGRISRTKGQKTALSALAILTERGHCVRLTFVGGGDASEVQRLASVVKSLGVEELVEFTGHVENALPYFSDADVALMCSPLEAFGRVTVEAMKMGCPVVGSDSGGTIELVRHGWNGLRFRPGDARALADCLEQLADDPALVDRLARNAYHWANEEFSLLRHVQAFHSFVDRVRIPSG